jgi:hypothetical protein
MISNLQTINVFDLCVKFMYPSPNPPSLLKQYPLYTNITIVQIIKRFLTSFGMTDKESPTYKQSRKKDVYNG